MAAPVCVCGHAESHHSPDAECTGDKYCGCIRFRDTREYYACSWCGGDGYTSTEPGPCSQCHGDEHVLRKEG